VHKTTPSKAYSTDITEQKTVFHREPHFSNIHNLQLSHL